MRIRILLLTTLLLLPLAMQAAMCPPTNKLAVGKHCLPPDGWQAAYHHRFPHEPFAFANVSVYQKPSHTVVYCYYHSQHKDSERIGTFVIKKEYKSNKVNTENKPWNKLYKGMHQCGTPDVLDGNYPRKPQQCKW